MASLTVPAAFSLIVPRRGPDLYANCTLETCDINTSYYFYRVSVGANATFLALFSISLAAFIVTFAATRRATAFTVAMCSGVALEVLGYAGRIMSWHNQWNDQGFLMQIVCLTIAPAFMAGGIYLCLRRIVYAFGPENSRITPEAYTRIVSPPTASMVCVVNPWISSSRAIWGPSSSRRRAGVSRLQPRTQTSLPR